MPIHPTAEIDPTAQLGKNVSVGAYTLIGPQVEIGDHCRIGPHVLIERNTRLGSRSVVCKGAAIGVAPEDFKFEGNETRLRIGDRAVLREHCTVSRGSEGETAIGDDFALMSYGHVGHDCTIGKGVVLLNAVTLLGHVTLGDQVLIGGLTFVSRRCRVGRLAFVAGGFRVAGDVPPFVVAADEPLRITGINAVALKKWGIRDDAVEKVSAAYKILHMGRENLPEALDKVKSELGDASEALEIIDFLSQSGKGIL